MKDVTTGVNSLLKYIGTLKGLASIRDAVWDLLKEVPLLNHFATSVPYYIMNYVCMLTAVLLCHIRFCFS